jgi:hypothetical protein
MLISFLIALIYDLFGFDFRHGFVMLDVQRIYAMYGLKHKLGDIHKFDGLMIRPFNRENLSLYTLFD